MDEAAGASLLFLPSYSLDYGPIENAFAKLKARLGKAAERIVNDLRVKTHSVETAGKVKPVPYVVLMLRAGQECRSSWRSWRTGGEGIMGPAPLLDPIDAHPFAFLVTTPDKVYTPLRFTPETWPSWTGRTPRPNPRTICRSPPRKSLSALARGEVHQL